MIYIEDEKYSVLDTNTDNIHDDDIARHIYDMYMYRHEIAMKTEYKMIDDETLYDMNDKYNNMVLPILRECVDKECDINDYYEVEGFASMVGLGTDMDKSVFYTYSRIMCGLTKIPTKRAN